MTSQNLDTTSAAATSSKKSTEYKTKQTKSNQHRVLFMLTVLLSQYIGYSLLCILSCGSYK